VSERAFAGGGCGVRPDTLSDVPPSSPTPSTPPTSSTPPGESPGGAEAGRPNRPGGVAFLLAQLGQHAADRFAERISALGLIPPQAGILRAIATEPGHSQQALSAQLGLLPSRVVAFVDDLERRGYVERRRNPDDRRLYALHLTGSGTDLMARIGAIGRAHEEEITDGLTAERRDALADTLATLAARHGLAPGVHPGYKSIGRSGTESATG
jgi:DNA-binding MarR family transcriptional regulator